MLMRLLRKPVLVIAVIVLISAGFSWKMVTNTRMETDLDEYMPQEHPAFVYSNQAEEWFDIKDGIVIAVEHPEGVFNQGTLQKIKDLTRTLQKLEEIEKADVTSLYTADNIVGTELGLDVRSFYDQVPSSQQELEELRRAVMGNEMVHGRLISADGTASLVVAEIEDDVFSQDFYRSILDIAESYQGPEKLYVAGRPIVEGTLAFLGPQDMKRMAPIVLVVIIAALLLLLRSTRAAGLTVAVVLISIVWTFGLMAVLNIPLYSVSTMIPVMLIAIGVADGIHMFSHLQLFRREHPLESRHGVVADMLRSMWKPVLMTSITTMVGFSSLVTSQVFPVKYFGLFTAFGVLAALLLSLLLIPAGIMVLGLPRLTGTKRKKRGTGMPSDRNLKNTRNLPGGGRNTGDGFAASFARRIAGNRFLIILITAAVIAAAVFGIGRVWINTSFLDNFSPDSDIVRTDAFINRTFGGTSTLNVILEGEEQDVMKQPSVLRAMDRIQEETESLDMVGASMGVTDYLKRMNKVMHADDPAYERIPESRDLVAQYLLLYEMSGDPENLWQVVDYDYQKANLTFQLKSDDSLTIRQAIQAIERNAGGLEEQGVRINYAGSGYKSLVFTDLILKGQISSLLLAYALIVILVTVMFRSLLVGLIGSVPVAVTAVINFGVMGLAGIPLSTTTALVSSIAIGIGVDYAIHFNERYRDFARSVKDRLAAGKLTMKHTGRAILFNAVVVIAGFLVLQFSVFPPNRALGALVSLNMFTSFIGTVTIMYLLLFLSGRYFRSKNSNPSTISGGAS